MVFSSKSEREAAPVAKNSASAQRSLRDPSIRTRGILGPPGAAQHGEIGTPIASPSGMETRMAPLDPPRLPPPASQGGLPASLRSPFTRGLSRQQLLKFLGLGSLALVATFWAWGKIEGDRKRNWDAGVRILRTTANAAIKLTSESNEGESSHDQKP